MISDFNKELSDKKMNQSLRMITEKKQKEFEDMINQNPENEFYNTIKLPQIVAGGTEELVKQTRQK